MLIRLSTCTKLQCTDVHVCASLEPRHDPSLKFACKTMIGGMCPQHRHGATVANLRSINTRSLDRRANRIT
ncbi:unnamed protein product [Sympodiomycopsis kandeliae]